MMTLLDNTPLTGPERRKAEALFLQYERVLLHAAARIVPPALAQEAVQEAFLSVMQHLHAIEEIDCRKTRAYLLTIVKRAALRRKALERGVREDLDDYAELLPDPGGDAPAAQMDAREAQERVAALLRRLPERYREVFIARYDWDWDYKTIAERFGLTEDHVSVILTRTRAKLRELVKGGKLDEIAGR